MKRRSWLLPLLASECVPTASRFGFNFFSVIPCLVFVAHFFWWLFFKSFFFCLNNSFQINFFLIIDIFLFFPSLDVQLMSSTAKYKLAATFHKLEEAHQCSSSIFHFFLSHVASHFFFLFRSRKNFSWACWVICMRKLFTYFYDTWIRWKLVLMLVSFLRPVAGEILILWIFWTSRKELQKIVGTNYQAWLNNNVIERRCII